MALSYIMADDLEDPLTPSHLLTGRRILSLPDYRGCESEEEDESAVIGHSQLTKRALYLNRTINQRWRKEYTFLN